MKPRIKLSPVACFAAAGYWICFAPGQPITDGGAGWSPTEAYRDWQRRNA